MPSCIYLCVCVLHVCIILYVFQFSTCSSTVYKLQPLQPLNPVYANLHNRVFSWIIWIMLAFSAEKCLWLPRAAVNMRMDGAMWSTWPVIRTLTLAAYLQGYVRSFAATKLTSTSSRSWPSFWPSSHWRTEGQVHLMVVSFIDNQPGRFALLKGYCKDPCVCILVSLTWRLLAHLGWHLQLEWVKSELNISDKVSRHDFSEMPRIHAERHEDDFARGWCTYYILLS